MADRKAKSILEMGDGAIAERADYEMARIIENIRDVNTRADKKRTLVLTTDILPDSERKNLRIISYAKSKLEPTNPVSTALYVTDDERGEFAVVELTPQIPGQINLSGEEQEPPALLKIVHIGG